MDFRLRLGVREGPGRGEGAGVGVGSSSFVPGLESGFEVSRYPAIS